MSSTTIAVPVPKGDIMSQALTFAFRPGAREIKQASEREEQLLFNHERLSRLQSGLYGIEVKAKPVIEQQLAALEAELSRVQFVKGSANSPYPLLDLTPLRWRNPAGYPVLAVFSLDSPKACFRVKAQDGWKGMRYVKSSQPKLPPIIDRCYDDVYAKLNRASRDRYQSVSLTAEFQGVIPLEVKEKIEEARPNVKEIFIVAEVSDWKLTKKAATPPVDPLVIGVDPSGQRLCLITHFDLTKTEEYILREFTTFQS